MISILFYAFISAFLSVLAYALSSYAVFKANSVEEYSEAIKDFYESIDPIVSDDETPIELLRLIDYLNLTISDRSIAGALLKHASRGRWSVSSAMPFDRKIATEFFVRRPELEKPYGNAVLSWFRAVTALSPLKGQLARVVIQEGAERRITVELAKSDKSHNRHGNGTVAAC